MQILLLSPLYWPYAGGAESHVRSLAEALTEQGNDVTVLTDQGSRELPAIDRLAGVRILRTTCVPSACGPEVVAWEHGFDSLRAAVNEALGRSSVFPDIIHAHCQSTFLTAAALKERYRCPLVVTPHETEPEALPLGLEVSKVLFRLEHIDVLIAGSAEFARQASTYGSPDVTLIESGLRNLPVFRRRKFDFDYRPARVLSVGRFKPRKNQLALVEAVARARSHGVNLRCSLVGSVSSGSAAYKDRIERRIRELDLSDAVSVHDDVGDQALESHLEQAHIVVVPSQSEGLGLAAIEAVCSGALVLSTPTLGALSAFRDFPEFLLAGFTSEHIASALEACISGGAESFQVRIAEASAQLRQRFDGAARARDVADVYAAVRARRHIARQP